jgi:hypothetical protein
VGLADQPPVEWLIEHRPTREPADEPTLRLHLAGHDLIPADTPISLGHLSWEALPALRAAARVHRPAPPDSPPPAGRELPLLVIIPEPEAGPALTASLAELDLFGVGAVEADDGDTVLVLAGGNAAEMLMTLPTRSPALAAFRRRLRQTNGRHAVMVADAASKHGNGAVYGLFECHQPPPAARPRATPRPSIPKVGRGKASSSRSRKR